MGLLATGKYKDNCVVVSGDKDMRTIPAWHCFIIDDSIEFVDNQKADLNFCTQVLTGDKSDGYIGCKGVGAVKASRILDGKKTYPQCGKQYFKSIKEMDTQLKTHITKVD